MWTELIARLYDDAEFAEPTDDAEIDRIEQRLGQKIPDDLRALLRETGGVQADYGSGLVWSVQEIIEQNTEFRRNSDFAELYKPFDEVMFIGDNGGGDQFAYVFRTPDEHPTEVFVWDHENDERIRVAGSLKGYLESRANAEGDDWYK